MPRVAALVSVFTSALTGNGASLGQRAVYIAPTSPDDARWRLVDNAAGVQGTGVVLVLLGIPWLLR